MATIPRRALISHLASGVPITFDCAVTDIARLAADVVVGADGHDSAVRRAVLGDGPAATAG